MSTIFSLSDIDHHRGGAGAARDRLVLVPVDEARDLVQGSGADDLASGLVTVHPDEARLYHEAIAPVLSAHVFELAEDGLLALVVVDVRSLRHLIDDGGIKHDGGVSHLTGPRCGTW